MSSSNPILVLGAGLAGVAAALAARAVGARVVVVRGRAGASALSSGAYDLEGPGAEPRREIPRDVTSVLGRASAPIEVADVLVASAYGALRSARARDVQVLAIDPSLPLLVPDVPVGSWDARAVASSLDDELRARGGHGARVLEGVFLRERDEMRMPVADLAALHDDGVRVDWLADRLHEALATHPGEGAILLPAIVGVAPSAIERLRARVRRPIGEALGTLGGAATLRFLAWSERALRDAAVEIVDGEVANVDARAELRVGLVDGRAIEASALVLATGGVLARGVEFGSGEHEIATELPELVRPQLRLGVRIERAEDREPIAIWLDGAPLGLAGSLFGRDGERFLLGDRPKLLRAGLAVDARMRVLDREGKPVSSFFAAGDVVEALPRTGLAAIASGVAAGKSASEIPVA